MEVEFAAYGDRNGAHAVRGATFDNSVVERTLQFTDLAWGLPDHLGDTPMYRGRPSGDHYVLVKTLRDPEASRSGMAASVAAFFPLDVVIHESRFQDLIALVPTPAHDPPALESRNLPRSAEGKSIPDVPGVRALTNALLARESDAPVMWAGIDSFIDVISALWVRLPPAMRRSFAFAFVCDPSDGNQRESSVIYCPSEFASRWSGNVVATECNDSAGVMSMAEEYIFDESVREEIDNTIKALEATVCSFADLRRVCLCHDTLQDLPSVSNIDATMLIRNIAILSPDNQLGQPIKKITIDDVCRRIQSEGVAVIGLIRNIEFDLFDASNKIAKACSLGIQSNLRNTTVSAKPIAELIKQSTTNSNRNWGEGVIRGVTEFALSGDEQSARRIWELLGEQPSLAVESEMLLPTNPKLDSCMAATAPVPIAQQVAELLTDVTVRQGYPELHAVTQATISTTQIAVECICEKWLADDRMVALRRLSTRVEFSEFLKCVEQFEEREFIEVAAEICISEPTLFGTTFSGTHRSWRLVFCRIVELSLATINNSEDLNIEVAASLQLLLEDELEPQYQLSLSQTKYANLLMSENRTQLWSRLDSAASPGFLNTTANAWIVEIHRGSTHTEEFEPELRDAILDRSIRSVLLPSEGDGVVESVVNAFGALPQLNEDHFEQWRQRFLKRNRSLSKLDAILLGEFVQIRKWENVAASIADDVSRYKRLDLRPAVSRCFDQLSWLKRWYFGDSDVIVSPDEWWDELEKNLIGLYSEGPSSKGVWERAHGDPADLLTDGTGASQWRHCLRELRNGFQSSELSVKSLLKIVSADYSNNSTVKVLKETNPT